MNQIHELPPAVFARLATGSGGAAAIETLRRAQLSRHLLLIGELLNGWPGPAAERDAVASMLERSRAAAPERFDRVLGGPLVGAWTGIASRAMLRELAVRADFDHLGALAVVACAAAGVDGEAAVPVRDGVIAVPGLGALTVPGAVQARLVTKDGRLTVLVDGHAITLPDDPRDERTGDPSQGLPGAAVWSPVRSLVGAAAGQRISIDLDDVDPFRHGHHAPPASRLPEDELLRWRELFEPAWAMLADRLPGRAGELAEGLRTLVPLVSADQRSARSATIRHAFGVFGLTRPPSSVEFAVTLVHEFQHSKLSAILDLVELTDPDDEGRYFAPWRTDPRPLGGLLQGVYAFVGVAETWQALRQVDGTAERQFAEARLQVDRGLTSVERSGALTPDGITVATHLRRVTDAMLAEPVPAEVARAAEAALDRTRVLWLERNGAQVTA